MQEKLNLAQYLHSIKTQPYVMVFLEHLQEVGIHFHISVYHFYFGHLWHTNRAVFQDIWTGVTISSLVSIEYGMNEKLGNYTTKTSTF